MIIPILLLILGFAVLIYGANVLVNGASAIAKRLGVSTFVIGLTIVAFGTSAPELIVNIFSSIDNQSDLVFGNIIGSNIFNILLILGIAGLIYPLSVSKGTVWREIPIALGAVVLLLVLANDFFFPNSDLMLSRIDAIILLVLFLGFLFYLFRWSKGESSDEEIKPYKTSKAVIYILIGLAGLFIGGKLVVDNAVKIAMEMHISEKLIALTIISGGTSLPELATSAVAAFKKNSDIAVGNVIGSNIFNILLILGVSALIQPAQFTAQMNLDLGILILATLFIFLFMFTMKRLKLDRTEAGIFLLMYIGYLVILLIRK